MRKLDIRRPLVGAACTAIALTLPFNYVPGNNLIAIAADGNPGKAAVRDPAASKSEAPLKGVQRPEPDGDEKEDMECRLPVVISWRERDAVFVRCEPGEDSDLQEESRLVSINGLPLRSMSIDEIRRLCTGNEGQTGVLGVLDREAGYRTVTFKCKWLQKQSSSHELSQLRSMLYNFDCSNGPHWERGPGQQTDHFDACNLDLFVAATCQGQVTLAMDDAASSAALVDSAAVNSVGPLLTIGNLSQARRYLKIIETTPAFDTEKPRRLDKHYGRLLTMLNLSGLSAEAVKIGAPVIAADQAGKFFTQGNDRFQSGELRLPVYKAYLRSLAATKSSALGQIAEYTQAIGKSGRFHGGDIQLWMGDLYESIGQFDKAIACYETTLSEREHPYGRTYTSKDSPDRQVSEARYHSYLLVRLSQFADQQKQPQKAVDYLLRAQQIYSSFFTAEQLVHIESQPLFCPSPSAVELALADAYITLGDSAGATKAAKSAVERLQLASASGNASTPKIPGDKELIDGLKSGKWKDMLAKVGAVPGQDEPTEAERAYMSVFMSTQTAIAGGDITKARPLIDTLIGQYKNRQLLSEYPRPNVNMYCTLLYLARRLADRGCYQESNKLLDRLQDTSSKIDHNSIAAIFIDIEQALNAALASRPDKALWQKVWKKWNCSYTDYEGLRALGCLYLAAGEYSRSEIMMDRALRLCKHNSKDDTGSDTGSDTRAAINSALLHLDKACLNSTTAHYDLAQKEFVKAMSAVDSAPATASARDLDLFNRMLICRAVQLAQLNRLAGRAIEAQNILKEIVSRVDNKKSWLGVFDDSARRSIDPSLSYLYGYYGRLLCDANKFSAARPYLDKAVSGCSNNVPDFLRIVRARCAAGQGDYAAAAQDMAAFAEHGNYFSASVISVQPAWKEAFSRLALDYALKAKGLNDIALSKIYRQLADTLTDDVSRKERLELNQKAYGLMPDNSREKIELAQEIANQLSALGRGNKAGNEKAEGQADASKFKMLESAAMLAEKNNEPTAPQLWMNLAGSEVQAKQYDQAFLHIKRAVEIKDKRPGYNLEGFQMPDFYDWPIRALAEAGRGSDTELLYQMMLKKAKSLYGPTSVEYSRVLANCAISYAVQKQREKALNYLDQLLVLDPRKQELGKNSQNGRKALLEGAYSLRFRDGQNVLARELQEKLLEAQRKTYGSDDSHVSCVLANMGTLETKEGAFEQAEKHLQEAMAIDALYGDETGFAGSSARSAMQNLLGKENKTAELQILIASQESTRKETERHWSLSQNASEERAQDFYNWWHKKAPYGHRCLSAAMKLLEYAVKKNDWERVRELAPECIDILSHNNLNAVGGCTPSPQPANRKFHCFKSMIEACLRSGHPDEARKWLDRAVSEESYEPMTEELLFLSEIEYACGDKREALSYCKRAEETLPKVSGWNYYRGFVTEMYDKLGAADDTKRIQADERAQRLIKQEEDLRKFEAQWKEKAKLEAQRKKPPTMALPTVRKAGIGNNQDSDENWSAEPNEALMFPPVKEVKDRYLFNYAAYASEDLWLKDGARVARFDGHKAMPSYSFAGSYTGIECYQPLHHAGQFMFLYDGLPGSLLPHFELPKTPGPGTQSGMPLLSTGSIFMAPPPVMARPFMPALEAPSTALTLPPSSDRLILKAGDYKSEHISTKSLVISSPGRVRIFLKDANLPAKPMFLEKQDTIWELQAADDHSITPVFEATQDSCINLVPAHESITPRSSLELWYNGKGVIRLGSNTNFTGLIYAPNAIIRLGKNVHFLGAMVAKEIIVGEDSTLMYQTNLQKWVANQSDKP